MPEPQPPNGQSSTRHAWERLRFALGAAGVGTWHLDLTSGLTLYDENLNRIFGLEPIESRAARDDRLTLVHPDDRDRVATAINRAISTRADFVLEFRIIAADGSIRWLRDRGRALTDDTGAVVAVTGAVMDITDRRRLEEHARQLADEREQLVRDLDRANHVKGDESLAVGRNAPRQSPDTLRGRRVLAVDDDSATQELVATMLVMYGVSVRTAGRSGQALRILTEWHPDVVLTDIAMPGEDGYALMRRIRSLPPPLGGIPAVAFTAYTDPESVQHAFSAGFDAHIGKPLEPHVLADALAKVLQLRRAG